MGLIERLTGKGVVNVQGEQVAGSYHPNESRTTPVAFHLEFKGQHVIGYGVNHAEAKKNAEQFLNRPPAPPSSTESPF
jgi:hypothetical protein